MQSVDGERNVEMLFDADVAGGESALSPDGRRLAYFRRYRTGLPALEVVPFPAVENGRWSVPQGDVPSVQPVWSTDGRELFFLRRSDLMMAPIETEPTFTIGTPRVLISLSDYEFGSTAEEARLWDVAPDGDRFLVRTSAAPTNDADGLVFVENWTEELKARVPVP